MRGLFAMTGLPASRKYKCLLLAVERGTMSASVTCALLMNVELARRQIMFPRTKKGRVLMTIKTTPRPVRGEQVPLAAQAMQQMWVKVNTRSTIPPAACCQALEGSGEGKGAWPTLPSKTSSLVRMPRAKNTTTSSAAVQTRSHAAGATGPLISKGMAAVRRKEKTLRANKNRDRGAFYRACA